MRNSYVTLRFIFAILALSLLVMACSTEEPNATESAITQTKPETAEPETPSTLSEKSSTSSSVLAEDNAIPQDPVDLATEIIEIESEIRLDETSAQRVAELGDRQQVLYRHLEKRHDTLETSISYINTNAPLAVKTAANNNLFARQQLTRLTNSESPSSKLPAWELNKPEDPDILLSHYKEASEATGIGWQYLAAINLVETKIGRINGTSTAGAVGPMQFLPSTWEECCEGDPTNSKDAIRGAAEYLIDRGGATSITKAIRGYNNSALYVDAVSAYAEVMAADEKAYYAYHSWDVYYRTNIGIFKLPVGYSSQTELDAATYLADNPELLFDAN